MGDWRSRDLVCTRAASRSVIGRSPLLPHEPANLWRHRSSRSETTYTSDTVPSVVGRTSCCKPSKYRGLRTDRKSDSRRSRKRMQSCPRSRRREAKRAAGPPPVRYVGVTQSLQQAARCGPHGTVRSRLDSGSDWRGTAVLRGRESERTFLKTPYELECFLDAMLVARD